jgi:hypothetical protein
VLRIYKNDSISQYFRTMATENVTERRADQFCAACDGMSSLEVWLSRAPSYVCSDEQSGRRVFSLHRGKGTAAPSLRTDARKVTKVGPFGEYR